MSGFHPTKNLQKKNKMNKTHTVISSKKEVLFYDESFELVFVPIAQNSLLIQYFLLVIARLDGEATEIWEMR